MRALGATWVDFRCPVEPLPDHVRLGILFDAIVGLVEASKVERGEKTPTPKISALLRKQPVLLRANFVLTKDRKWPYYGHFCGKIHREGSCSKAAGGP